MVPSKSGSATNKSLNRKPRLNLCDMAMTPPAVLPPHIKRQPADRHHIHDERRQGEGAKALVVERESEEQTNERPAPRINRGRACTAGGRRPGVPVEPQSATKWDYADEENAANKAKKSWAAAKCAAARKILLCLREGR